MNFGEYNEFEISNINDDKMSKLIEEKKVYFNHKADKIESNKYDYGHQLIRVDEKLLPEYLIKNKGLYKEWFDL